MRILCATVAVIVALFASLPGQSSAGILDDFEDDATSKSESDTTDSRGSSGSFAESCLTGCLNSIFQSMIEGLFSGDSDDSSEEETSVFADSPSPQPSSVSSSPSFADPIERYSSPEADEEPDLSSSSEASVSAESLSVQPPEIPADSSFPEPRVEPRLPSSSKTPVYAESPSVQPPEVPSDSPVSEQRIQESFHLPTLYVDVRYERVEPDVNVFDGGLEVGYEFFGADFRYTHYVEDDPPDELDVYQWHGLLRWAATDRFETGVGIGALTLSGNKSTTGTSMTVPVRVTFEAPAALVFRPSWSWLGDNTIGDYDASVHYLWPNVSAFLGYRWFVSGKSSLEGAFAGVSVRF